MCQVVAGVNIIEGLKRVQPQVTLKCGVLFDGHDTEVTVALRYLEVGNAAAIRSIN